MYGLDLRLDEDGTWLCGHADDHGRPAPATRLRLSETSEWNPGVPTSAPRRWIRCPDCGTYWRVWVLLRVAKPSAEWIAAARPTSERRYRRAPVRDIDKIIDLVRRQLPGISVVQHHDVWPGDDEGVWFFQLQHISTRIQLESSTGTCPFIFEQDGMKSAGEAGSASSVDEAAQVVVSYLDGQATECGSPGAG
jgi:hypothetical protein